MKVNVSGALSLVGGGNARKAASVFRRFEAKRQARCRFFASTHRDS
jgi:hypothetical protein